MTEQHVRAYLDAQIAAVDAAQGGTAWRTGDNRVPLWVLVPREDPSFADVYLYDTTEPIGYVGREHEGAWWFASTMDAWHQHNFSSSADAASAVYRLWAERAQGADDARD